MALLRSMQREPKDAGSFTDLDSCAQCPDGLARWSGWGLAAMVMKPPQEGPLFGPGETVAHPMLILLRGEVK